MLLTNNIFQFLWSHFLRHRLVPHTLQYTELISVLICNKVHGKLLPENILLIVQLRQEVVPMAQDEESNANVDDTLRNQDNPQDMQREDRDMLEGDMQE